MSRFDAIVIGTGQAGPPLAGRLTAAGMTVAVVERKLVGGTCVNTGCTPTKTLVASAQAAYSARHAAPTTASPSTAPSGWTWRRVKARAEAVAASSRTGVEGWLRKMKGCTLLEGHARFEAPDRLRVGADVLTAPRIFINVGGRPSVPPLPGIDDVPFLTNRTMLELDQVPEHLRGRAAATSASSSPRCTVASEPRSRSSSGSPPDRTRGRRRLGSDPRDPGRRGRHQSARRPSAFASAVTSAASRCSSTAQDGEPTAVGSHVLLAVGRRPNTDDLGWTRPEWRPMRAATSPWTTRWPRASPGSGRWATATDAGLHAHRVQRLRDRGRQPPDGEHRRVSTAIPAYALFIDPPLGRAGKSRDRSARERPATAGRPAPDDPRRPRHREGRHARLHEGRRRRGDAQDPRRRDPGTGGDEAIHGILDVMNAGSPYDALQRAVPIHPTVSELIPTMLGELKPDA